MMKQTKRILALTLAAVLLLCCIPATASAAGLVDSGYGSGDGYSCYWELDTDGTLWIFGSGNLQSSSWDGHRDEIKKVVIGPDHAKDDFHALGDTLFYNYPNLTSVEICDTVRSIGQNTFDRCPQLAEVKLPASLEAIGSSAFSNCTVLANIQLPEGVTSIGESAFDNCKALTEITLPAGLTSLGAAAFNYCTSLTSISLPAGITEVSGRLFFYCSSLSQVTLPEGLTRIDRSAFMYCDGLTELSLPDSVVEIGESAFYDCDNLAQINLPEGLTTIGESAFSRCFDLKDFTVPASVTSIGSGAFSETGLSTFHVGENLLDMTGVLDGCRHLTTLTVAENHPNYSADDQGILYNKDQTEVIFCLPSRKEPVTLPASVKVIKSNAFSSCNELTGINLNEGLEVLEDFSLMPIYAVKELKLPSTLKTIGQSAINGGMTSITIPAGVESLGRNALGGSDLKQIIVDSGNKHFASTENGIVTSKDGKTLVLLPPAMTSYIVIPDGITAIPENFFANSQATEIVLPDSVTTLGRGAFESAMIETITLPAGITEIPEDLFSNTRKNLKEVIILGDITSIGEGAFNNCRELVRVCFASSQAEIEPLINARWYEDSLNEVEIVYDYVPAPACKHEIQVTPGKAPTCSEEGLTEGKACTLCGKVFQKQETISPTWEHTVVAAPDVEPTCTQEGSIGGLICSVCGQWIADPDEYLPPLDHTWVSEPIREPTCSQEGILEGGLFCSVCGWIEVPPVVVPPLDHTWNEVAPKEPTCTEDGWKAHFSDCEHCGEPFPEPGFSKEIIPALGHSWNEGVVTKEPTESTEGEKTFTCTGCGETKTESIPALEHTHSYTSEVTKPTCTDGGYTTHTCACGDSYVDSHTDALGHIYDGGVVTKEPTITETGIRTYTCTTCGATKEETIPVLSHTHEFGPWIIDSESVLNGAAGTKHRVCECGETETAAYSNPLVDVPNGKYFTKPIFWAYENGITKGKTATEFQRDAECTRKQIVMFLWRAAGQPEPKSMENPFVDVKQDQFEKAILWAYYEGITSGKTATEFQPEAPCTREQIVMFLWRYFGKPAPQSMVNPFTDVKVGGTFEKAILWAYYEGITTGKTATTFEPQATCTRGQIVTFLYRAMVE